MKLFFKLLALPLLVLGLPFAIIAENQPHVKQQEWEQLSFEVDTWVDGLGLPIDVKIKEAVVALNALGFVTRQSCEGHLDWGLPYPWVDFAVVSQVEMQNDELYSLYKKAQDLVKILEEKYPHMSFSEQLNQEEAIPYSEYMEKIRFLSKKIELARKIQLQVLYSLVEEFYQNHPSFYDRNLYITDYFRLQSIGGEQQIIRSFEEREIKLREYQEEMNAFTSFLKDKYFCN